MTVSTDVLAAAATTRRSLDSTYESVRARVLGHVSRWEWDAVGTWREIPIPHWAELHELDPQESRPRAKPPKRLASAVQYGLDSEGSVIAARNYMSGDEVTDERFIEGDGQRVVLSAYRRQWPGGPATAGFACVGQLRGGRVTEWARSTSDTVFEALRLHYDDDGRLARVDVRSQDRAEEPKTYTIALAYGPDGQLERLVDDGPGVMYVAPGDRPPLTTAVAPLVDTIAAAAIKAAPADPTFALVLTYDYATLLPPSLGFISRGATEAASRTGADVTFWNAAEHHFMPEPSYEMARELSDLLAAVNSELRGSDSDEPLRTVMLELARRLQSFDWPPAFARSDDFVAVAVDVELLDVRRNLHDLLGVAGFEALRARSLI